MCRFVCLTMTNTPVRFVVVISGGAAMMVGGYAKIVVEVRVGPVFDRRSWAVPC